MKEGGIRISGAAKKQPVISIITVVYNAAILLSEFLETIGVYLSDEVELIIADGGSTDNSAIILEQHNYLIDYWRSEPDSGIYDAMNKAVTFARGKWLYFMGADDRLLNGFSKSLKLLQNPTTIYYAKVIYAGEIFGNPIKRYHLSKFYLSHQSIFYPARVFQFHHYNSKYKIYADQYLNVSCYADKRFKWQFLDQLIAIYDTRGFSSDKIDDVYLKDLPQIIKDKLGRWIYWRHKFRKFKADKKLK